MFEPKVGVVNGLLCITTPINVYLTNLKFITFLFTNYKLISGNWTKQNYCFSYIVVYVLHIDQPIKMCLVLIQK